MQRRLHTSPRNVFTRFPQQTLSHQSQNNVLQKDNDGGWRRSCVGTKCTFQPSSGLITRNNGVFFNLCQVLINNGFTPDKEDYEFCTKIENMIIPTEGFFGISAATGGLAGIILLPLPNIYRINVNTLFCSRHFQSVYARITFLFSSSHMTFI